MRLYDCASVMRSKNAGPFTLTVDLMFADAETFDRVLGSPAFDAGRIAELYGVPADAVSIRPFRRVLAIKVSLARAFGGCGAPGDRDVYGAQQHFPLGDVEV